VKPTAKKKTPTASLAVVNDERHKIPLPPQFPEGVDAPAVLEDLVGALTDLAQRLAVVVQPPPDNLLPAHREMVRQGVQREVALLRGELIRLDTTVDMLWKARVLSEEKYREHFSMILAFRAQLL
jgi:hypothetical protein